MWAASCAAAERLILLLQEDTFQQYVKPEINPKLSNFCISLTGITQVICTFVSSGRNRKKKRCGVDVFRLVTLNGNISWLFFCKAYSLNPCFFPFPVITELISLNWSFCGEEHSLFNSCGELSSLVEQSTL